MLVKLRGLVHYYAGAMLALLLIGAGRVRSARREALNPDVISAISFHKPEPAIVSALYRVADRERIHLHLSAGRRRISALREAGAARGSVAVL